MAIRGGCLCGAVRFETEAAPAFVSKCYCADCQKASGTGHVTIVAVPAAALSIEGTPRRYTKKGDSGQDVTRVFCPTCGGPLVSEVAAAPGMVFIKAGAIDAGDALAPAMAFYVARAPEWDRPPTGLQCFETMPG